MVEDRSGPVPQARTGEQGGPTEHAEEVVGLRLGGSRRYEKSIRKMPLRISFITHSTVSRVVLDRVPHDLRRARTEGANLQSQVEPLTEQLQDAPDDATISSILAGARPQPTNVQATIATLNTAICTSSSATTTSG
jgi:hypothetical protein